MFDRHGASLLAEPFAASPTALWESVAGIRIRDGFDLLQRGLGAPPQPRRAGRLLLRGGIAGPNNAVARVDVGRSECYATENIPRGTCGAAVQAVSGNPAWISLDGISFRADG